MRLFPDDGRLAAFALASLAAASPLAAQQPARTAPTLLGDTASFERSTLQDAVELGGVTLTAHKTAGHTRGCTTWTSPVHLPGDPADRVRNVVIVGGVSFWSDFHFTDRPGQPAS